MTSSPNSGSAAHGSFDTAFKTMSVLCSNFAQYQSTYMDKGYPEAAARKDFIDKLLITLGWDVNSERQPNPYQREVRVEQTVQTRQGRKKADYALYVAPEFERIRLFVEAKRPAEPLATPDNYFQAIRYGFNKNHSLVVLTNFYETHILDCRAKPDIKTAITKGLLQFNFHDYLDKEKFKELYFLIARDEVASGSIERFVATQKRSNGKQGKLIGGGSQALDTSFLADLDRYRELLAKAFKKDSPELDGESLTEITQRTIDRLVFIRFLEDKLILAEPIVETFTYKTNAWASFRAHSKSLDSAYNGIVFKPLLALDKMEVSAGTNQIFSDICEELSGRYSPYDFSLIPIHILGSIYERFLGKVIRATAKQVKVEEKEEVRKAGGVYYTPEYIVRYIVKQTVGEQMKGKTLEEIAKLRFADIACGSGSFLLGVFDEVLNYYRAWLNARPAAAKKYGCTQNVDGVWLLPLHVKRGILLANVYGVDIDAQAVEVAQLSLYLRLLEEETTHSAYQFGLDHHEPLLPSLGKNIVCGNSLVGRDIYESDLFADTDDSEQRKLNAMNFEDAFPQVMKGGGFDAIVGNPPYGRLLSKLTEAHVANYVNRFASMPDVYVAFIWRAKNLLKLNGKLAYITPSAWLGGPAYLPLREMLLQCKLDFIVALPFDVFADAYIDTLIFVLSNTTFSAKQQVLCYDYNKKTKIEIVNLSNRDYSKVSLSTWRESNDKKFVLSAEIASLVLKLRQKSSKVIGDFLEIKRGVLFEKALLTSKASSKKSHPYFEGDVYRYTFNYQAPQWIEYGAKMKEFPKEFKWFEGERLLLRRLVNRQQRLMSTLTEKTCITNKNLYSLLPKAAVDMPLKDRPSLYFYLGILNSKLLSKLYLLQVQQATKNDFPQVTIKDVAALPYPDEVAGTSITKLVGFVKRMLTAKSRLSTAITEKDKDFYTRECTAIDRQIDALVYELYGLTEKEISLIEGDVA